MQVLFVYHITRYQTYCRVVEYCYEPRMPRLFFVVKICTVLSLYKHRYGRKSDGLPPPIHRHYHHLLRSWAASSCCTARPTRSNRAVARRASPSDCASGAATNPRSKGARPPAASSASSSMSQSPSAPAGPPLVPTWFPACPCPGDGPVVVVAVVTGVLIWVWWACCSCRYCCSWRCRRRCCRGSKKLSMTTLPVLYVTTMCSGGVIPRAASSAADEPSGPSASEARGMSAPRPSRAAASRARSAVAARSSKAAARCWRVGFVAPPAVSTVRVCCEDASDVMALSSPWSSSPSSRPHPLAEETIGVRVWSVKWMAKSGNWRGRAAIVPCSCSKYFWVRR